MTSRLRFKAAMIWLLMAVLAIANGAFREGVLVHQFDALGAQVLSGVSLCLIVLAVIYFSINWFQHQPCRIFIWIGFQWLMMTVAFEFLFGHYVVGHAWQTLIATFTLSGGNLMLVLLIETLITPYIFARLKQLCD